MIGTKLTHPRLIVSAKKSCRLLSLSFQFVILINLARLGPLRWIIYYLSCNPLTSLTRPSSSGKKKKKQNKKMMANYTPLILPFFIFIFYISYRPPLQHLSFPPGLIVVLSGPAFKLEKKKKIDDQVLAIDNLLSFFPECISN